MTTATKTARPRPTHNGAAQNGADHGADHNGADHNGADHNGADHNGADHNGADHNGAEHNGAAATDVALAWMVTETVVAALTETSTVAGEIIAHTTVAVESAAGTAKERMPGGVTAVVKKIAGLTVDTYQQVTTQQLAIAIVLADAVPVDWVSELTHRNADAIGELVAVSAGAAHELLE